MKEADRRVQSKDEVLAIIAKHSEELHTLGVKELWLVGSAARDQLRPDSDIDVIVSLAQPLGLAFFEIGIQLEAWLGRRVDIGTRDGLRERARVTMDREAVRAAI